MNNDRDTILPWRYIPSFVKKFLSQAHKEYWCSDPGKYELCEVCDFQKARLDCSVVEYYTHLYHEYVQGYKS